MLTLILYIVTSIFCGGSTGYEIAMDHQDQDLLSEIPPLENPDGRDYCSYFEESSILIDKR